VLFDICDKAVTNLKGYVTSEPFAVKNPADSNPGIILLSWFIDRPMPVPSFAGLIVSSSLCSRPDQRQLVEASI
jgi:hypothetical protein